MVKLLKGAFAVVVLALMTVFAARLPEEGTGPFQELFQIAGKWPFIGAMALLTVYSAFAVWRDYARSAAPRAPAALPRARPLPRPVAPPVAPAKHPGRPATGYSADRIARALGQTAAAPAAAAVVAPPPPVAPAVSPPPATPSPQSTPPISDADRQLVARMLEGITAQVDHEERMIAARGKEPVSVRLVPQVPVRAGADAKSWLGGGARLPEGCDWPEEEGIRFQLLAQLSCAELPAGLWDGAGPRHGWLAIFLNPRTAQPLVLHFADAGPYQASPAVDENCNIVGHDMRPAKDAERPPPVPAFPRWPVDVVTVLNGENDPRAQGSSDIHHRRYAEDWDATEPRFQPFDWPSAQVMMDMAVKTTDKRLYRGDIRAQLKPDGIAAAEARLADARAQGEDAKKLLEMQLNLDFMKASVQVHDHAVAHGDAMVGRLKALQSDVAAMAASRPFSAAAMAPILAEMHGLTYPSMKEPPLYRDGKPRSIEERAEEGIRVRTLPVTAHDRDRLSWASGYVGYLQDRAKHLYAADPASLPEPLRADCEALWKDRAAHDMGGMGHVPWNYVHEFDDGKDVTLLELPSSNLMNWQFGDVDHLVLTLPRADLAQGRFDRVKMQVSN